MARPTLRHVEPSWRGDTVLGILEGVRLGYAAQDVNVQMLAGDTFAAAHWGAIGKAGNQNPWRGPDVPAGTPLHKITAEQWQALTPYDTTVLERPALAVDIIAAALPKWRFTPCFEVKPGEGTHQTRPYALLKAAAIVHQVPVIAMTIQSYGSTVVAKASWEASAKLRMKAAKAAGLPTMLLWRHSIPATSDWWPLLDAVKGAPASQALPPNVVRVPNTATSSEARAVLAKVTAKVDWKGTPVVTPLRIDGVDLSHHQSGVLDFAAFAKAGGQFVYHKATEGDTFTDDKYVQRMGEVRAAGLIYGAYHYAHPDSSSGVDQAKRFLSVARPMPGDMLPALDLETAGGLNQVELTKWVGAFVGEVKRQFGVLPVIYTNQNLASDFGCPLWVARYSNSNAAPIMPTPFTRISIRQFSEGLHGVPKTAPGLGAVDLDHLPDGVKLDGLRIPAASTTPDPPTPEDLMTRVNLGSDTSGRPLVTDKRTLLKLRKAEADLGFTFTIVQGSWRGSGGASASAGTHDAGGVIDLRSWNLPASISTWAAVLALRRAGLIAWYRTKAQGFDPHIHCVDYGNPALSPSARAQVKAWEAGRNGLANNGNDDGPRITIPKQPPEDDDMPTEDATRRIVKEEVAKALKAANKVDVPESWSDADKPGTDTTVANAIEMVMRELIRMRKPAP